MDWSEVAARSHARRLEKAGWLERSPMLRGDGSIFRATRSGVRMLGLEIPAAPSPAPTWWAHHCASAWTAAWLTVRDRTFLGPRELLVDDRWSAPLNWMDSHGAKRSSHRPDLIAWVSAEHAIALEVELAPKSQTRLRAILNLHYSWAVSRRTYGVLYVCADETGRERIRSAARHSGFFEDSRRLRIDVLDEVVGRAKTGY